MEMTTRQPGKTGEMKNQGPLGSHCTDQMKGPGEGFDPAAGLGLFRDLETKRVDQIGTVENWDGLPNWDNHEW
jgi:hypothetical protein